MDGHQLDEVAGKVHVGVGHPERLGKASLNATTVEQIAEAAEISPATFFRYFPTKEHLVSLDRFPPPH
ncbi:helix-turn-helix domain-containing protein [Nonomuraea helvata]|uniref:Helix-turn-helix domain-containing protein n=1 Tax=Nonomuraea helvata TaxID=37484 RepID=A0ABV5SCZ5_9ACTN